LTWLSCLHPGYPFSTTQSSYCAHQFLFGLAGLAAGRLPQHQMLLTLFFGLVEITESSPRSLKKEPNATQIVKLVSGYQENGKKSQ
jgi:hypothetical protein